MLGGVPNFTVIVLIQSLTPKGVGYRERREPQEFSRSLTASIYFFENYYFNNVFIIILQFMAIETDLKRLSGTTGTPL